MGTRRLSGGPTVFGSALVLLGVLFLLDTLDVVGFGEVMFHWWPLLLVGVGLFNLTQVRSPLHASVWFPALLGAVFLVVTLEYLSWSQVFRLWPVVLIALGLAMIFGRTMIFGRVAVIHGFETEVDEGDEAVLRVAATLATVERKVKSNTFRGGEVSAFLGWAKIDLSRAELSGEGAKLNASAFLGEVSVIIPRHWRVELNPSAALGEVKELFHQDPQQEGPTLVVNASSTLATVKIRN